MRNTPANIEAVRKIADKYVSRNGVSKTTQLAKPGPAARPVVDDDAMIVARFVLNSPTTISRGGVTRAQAFTALRTMLGLEHAELMNKISERIR